MTVLQVDDPSDITWLNGDYDYVIVGAGTAGCVLANRLSANPKCRVLLLEAGGSDNYHWVHIPVGYLFCIGNPRTDWMMQTASEPGLNGRRLQYPRGKVLGGCTSVNGMIYMRGQAADYDHWRQLGNVGWSWEDVLPYFLKSEDHYGGDTELHRKGGEWRVSKQRLQWEILKAVQTGAEEFGVFPRADFNDGNNEGSGYFEVNQEKGIRWNAAKAFLRPATKRPNLRVMTDVHVEKLVLEGRRAVAVRFDADGKKLAVRAQSEILLAAGSINSPKILELSGIGNADILRQHGIQTIHEINSVGENLQDHLQIRTVFRVSNAKTLNTIANSFLGKARMAFEYALKRSGPMSMAPSQFGMFTKSDPTLETPDLEYHVQPLSTDKLGDPLHPFPAITISVCNLRPDSSGSVHISSNTLRAQPDICLNYLSADRDKDVAVASVRQARKIMTAKALEHHSPEEILPGPKVQNNEDLLEAIGNIATTIFHPVGTCRMGADEKSVVDPFLRVRGIDRLRVIDASIMPKIVSGNTASPVIMIAEKAADMIKSTG